MKLVSDYFGCMVFDDSVMKAMLSEEDYNTLKRTVKDGRSLKLSVANAVGDSPILHGGSHGVCNGQLEAASVFYRTL